MGARSGRSMETKVLCSCCFFFQAEDGIRDVAVTGVQTCALPILTSMVMSGVVLLFMAFAGRSPVFVLFVAFLGFFLFAIRAVLQAWLLDATPRHMGDRKSVV